jgi:hypothetical protein
VSPEVHVLSAEHGLLAIDAPVRPYDRRMTAARADALRPTVEPALAALAHGRPTCLALGARYRRAAGDAAPHAVRLSGGIGAQLAALRRWLGAPPPAPAPGLPPRLAALDGVTPADAARLARERAPADPAATRLGAYAVPVGPLQVAPKWLVAQLSGLPVAEFRTADALRALAHLGLPVLPT